MLLSCYFSIPAASLLFQWANCLWYRNENEQEDCPKLLSISFLWKTNVFAEQKCATNGRRIFNFFSPFTRKRQRRCHRTNETRLVVPFCSEVSGWVLLLTSFAACSISPSRGNYRAASYPGTQKQSFGWSWPSTLQSIVVFVKKAHREPLYIPHRESLHAPRCWQRSGSWRKALAILENESKLLQDRKYGKLALGKSDKNEKLWSNLFLLIFPKAYYKFVCKTKHAV